MVIYGVDFTSAPTARKPIVIACGVLEYEKLQITGFETLKSLSAFYEFLQTAGPWVGGFDFPFSQPRKFLSNAGYPLQWEDLMDVVSQIDKKEWEQILNRYRENRDAGDKQHLRATDKIAEAISPMMVYGVPVAKMFLAGAVALFLSGVHIPGLRENEDSRIALEIYPATVARLFIGREPYKTDSKSKDTEQRRRARKDALNGMLQNSYSIYKTKLQIDYDLCAKILGDFRGDYLDAVAAALVAAWACREENYGIPEDVDELEGWIVGPGLSTARNR